LAGAPAHNLGIAAEAAAHQLTTKEIAAVRSVRKKANSAKHLWDDTAATQPAWNLRSSKEGQDKEQGNEKEANQEKQQYHADSFDEISPGSNATAARQTAKEKTSAAEQATAAAEQAAAASLGLEQERKRSDGLALDQARLQDKLVNDMQAKQEELLNALQAARREHASELQRYAAVMVQAKQKELDQARLQDKLVNDMQAKREELDKALAATSLGLEQERKRSGDLASRLTKIAWAED
jgi:hypothetical protein